jgi:glucose/arabinose dehydrogenase
MSRRGLKDLLHVTLASGSNLVHDQNVIRIRAIQEDATNGTARGNHDGGRNPRNIQKVFAYGIRNTFGMAFDPASGELWLEQNGDDSFVRQAVRIGGANSV